MFIVSIELLELVASLCRLIGVRSSRLLSLFFDLLRDQCDIVRANRSHRHRLSSDQCLSFWGLLLLRAAIAAPLTSLFAIAEELGEENFEVLPFELLCLGQNFVETFSHGR